MPLRKKIEQTRPIQLNGYGFRRSFFEISGYWKATAAWFEIGQGPVLEIHGRRAIPTQVVDFHGNSG